VLFSADAVRFIPVHFGIGYPSHSPSGYVPGLALGLELLDVNRPRRIVLVLCSLLLAYCCVWIPWRSRCEMLDWRYQRAGYGWVWTGPERYRSLPTLAPLSPDANHYAIESEARQAEAVLELKQEAVPDFALIGLQLLAASAISAAALLLAGIRNPSATRN
jgi:hypothetical protein